MAIWKYISDNDFSFFQWFSLNLFFTSTEQLWGARLSGANHYANTVAKRFLKREQTVLNRVASTQICPIKKNYCFSLFCFLNGKRFHNEYAPGCVLLGCCCPLRWWNETNGKEKDSDWTRSSSLNLSGGQPTTTEPPFTPLCTASCYSSRRSR